MRRLITASLILAGMSLGSGPAFAQSRPDPMRAARLGMSAPSASDPMVALIAPTDGGEAGAEGNAEFGGLPDGPGAEDTYYQCTACHSTEIIKQQRLTDARWDYLWDWMVKDQGMFEPDEDSKAVILGYLKTHFSAEE